MVVSVQIVKDDSRSDYVWDRHWDNHDCDHSQYHINPATLPLEIDPSTALWRTDRSHQLDELHWLEQLGDPNDLDTPLCNENGWKLHNYSCAGRVPDHGKGHNEWEESDRGCQVEDNYCVGFLVQSEHVSVDIVAQHYQQDHVRDYADYLEKDDHTVLKTSHVIPFIIVIFFLFVQRDAIWIWV